MNDIIEQVQTWLPAWRGRVRSVTALDGGITNKNYKVTVDDEAFVVRVCATNMGIHGINRQAEHQCNLAAAGIGISPALIAFLDNLPGGKAVFVHQFITGRTLTPDEIRSPDHLSAIVAIMQRYHALPNFAGRFDVFRIFANGLAFARDQQAPLPPFIEQVQTEIQQIEAAFQRDPLPLAACHNDLLASNCLVDQQGRLWLLDWEYAGWGDPCFDLGNLAVNNEFDDAADEALLSAYWGQVTAPHLARLKLMKIVSDAREGIWAMVQWSISDLEFDFAAYGQRHLERFMHNCASPAVKGWLRELNKK